MTERTYYYPLLLFFLAGLFFLPGLGAISLFDWDEINFAEISREMILTGNYTQVFIDFQPFWEKPPLFFWLQVAAMKTFGINEFAARLPNALCGILTLQVLYQIGKKLYDARFGFLWALVYLGSVLPNLYFHSGIIDPVFNLLIFLGLYGMIWASWKRAAESQSGIHWSSLAYLLGGGLLLGMAVLTKGPVAGLIVGLCIVVYWLWGKFRWFLPFPQLLLYGLSASLLTLAWFGWETWKNGTWFVEEFITYQIRLFSTEDAGHGGFPGYHVVVLLIGCFPASVFALGNLFAKPTSSNQQQNDFMRWMKILFWVVLILFSIVQSKIVHYSSLCYFPLTYLAAVYLQNLLEKDQALSRGLSSLLTGIAALFILAICFLPLAIQHLDDWISLIKDPFVVASLDPAPDISTWAILPGLFLLLLISLFLFFFITKKWPAIQCLFIGNAAFVLLTLFYWIGPIEQFSQAKVIDFWKSSAGKDIYRMTFEYKSYAHLFYGEKQAGDRAESRNSDWLLKGPIDKPVYISCKAHKAKKLQQYPDIEQIGKAGGFVFFLRKPAE